MHINKRARELIKPHFKQNELNRTQYTARVGWWKKAKKKMKKIVEIDCVCVRVRPSHYLSRHTTYPSISRAIDTFITIRIFAYSLKCISINAYNINKTKQNKTKAVLETIVINLWLCIITIFSFSRSMRKPSFIHTNHGPVKKSHTLNIEKLPAPPP